MSAPKKTDKPNWAEKAADWWRGLQRTTPEGKSNPTADSGALARLRRCATPMEALAESATIRLCRLLGCKADDDRRIESVALLAIALAHVREDAPKPATLGGLLGANREGGDMPVMSDLRLRQMMAARDGQELVRAFREALTLLNGKAPVEDLAHVVLDWRHPTRADRTRTRFLFAYHGALEAAPPPGGDAPAAV